MSKAFVKSRVIIEAKYVNRNVLPEYELSIYNEDVCRRCQFVQHRPVGECDGCPANTSIRMWKQRVINGRSCFVFPVGDLDKIASDHNIDEIIDLRPRIPMDNDIKFIGKLHTGDIVNRRQTVDQRSLISQWFKAKGGIICSPPGSGKTVMACAIACLVKLKTLIIAHQQELLDQFYRTFMGDGTRAPLTNIPDMPNPKSIIRIIRNMKDLEDNPDIALVNYQKFIRESGPDRIKMLNGRYSLLVNDEVHHGSADAYSRFLGALDMRYRVGLTATPDRRDGRSKLSYNFIGKVSAIAEQGVSMPPAIKLFETGVKEPAIHKTWHGGNKFLANSKVRNAMIVNQVFIDLEMRKPPYQSIIIPVDYISHAKKIKDLINNDPRAEKWANKDGIVAEVFSSKSNRKKVISGVEDNSIKVLVSIRSMIKEGIDLTPPSIIYMVVPMGATEGVGSPLCYQMALRVSRWGKDKPQPIIRYFLDGTMWSYNCWKSVFWKELLPGLKGSKPKYKMEKDEFERAIMVAKSKKYVPLNKAGTYVTSGNLLNDYRG